MLSPTAADAAGPALASMLIYLLMAVVLALKPQGLFPRTLMKLAQPRDRDGAGPAAARGGAAARVALNQPFYLDLVRRIMIFAIAAASLNLILGYGGMVSFGHAAYLGVGAYAVGILAHLRHLRTAGCSCVGRGRRPRRWSRSRSARCRSAPAASTSS